MRCPKCGMNLRDPDVSHSEFGQWVHDNLPRHFFWTDVDGVIYKRLTKILRILEEKRPGQELKKSQQHILPLLAEGIKFLVDRGVVAEQSGVFVVHTKPPYEKAHIKQIGNKQERELSREEFKSFVSGNLLEETLPDGGQSVQCLPQNPGWETSWETNGLLLWLRENSGYRQLFDVGLVDVDLFKKLPGKSFRWGGWFVLISVAPSELMGLENGFELAVTQGNHLSHFDPRLVVAHFRDCKRTAWTIESLVTGSFGEMGPVLLRQRFSGTVELLLEPWLSWSR